MNKTILTNKTVLIVGATGGVGKEVAKLFSKESCNLILTGRNKSALDALEQTLESPKKIQCYEISFNKNDNIEKKIEKLAISKKNVDIFINCIGVFRIKTINKYTEEAYNQMMDINIKVPFFMAQSCSKSMKQKKLQWLL